MVWVGGEVVGAELGCLDDCGCVRGNAFGCGSFWNSKGKLQVYFDGIPGHLKFGRNTRRICSRRKC